MHGYYYDQNRVYPAEGPGPGRPRSPKGPGRGIALLCCAVALLLLASVVLRWAGNLLGRAGVVFHRVGTGGEDVGVNGNAFGFGHTHPDAAVSDGIVHLYVFL